MTWINVNTTFTLKEHQKKEKHEEKTEKCQKENVEENLFCNIQYIDEERAAYTSLPPPPPPCGVWGGLNGESEGVGSPPPPPPAPAPSG